MYEDLVVISACCERDIKSKGVAKNFLNKHRIFQFFPLKQIFLTNCQERASCEILSSPLVRT